ncbi:hypothetical protein C2G38_2160263 [Gigaspora rosea]|uniref:Uncharacterized protein n=1 Tax=Gigaspora rosea TaxID=44941 RepID=A0A397VYF7_9GLOM|nr:hypothetical protein C2G38_2160263 [Gigaspora rosea]
MGIAQIPVYQMILRVDEGLWSDINKRFKYPNGRISSKVLPPRTILVLLRATNEVSNVINEDNAAEVASGINYKTIKYSVANNPYNFNLLLRGSRDGFTVKELWRLYGYKSCKYEVLGGYNPVGWNKYRRRI